MFIRIHRLNKNAKYGIVALAIYTFNRFFLKKLNIAFIGYVLKNHFNDFLGGFLFCCYVNYILYISNRKMITKFVPLLIFMFFVSLCWEFVFPKFLSYSTSDILDVLAYMLGTITYYFLVVYIDNKKKN